MPNAVIMYEAASYTLEKSEHCASIVVSSAVVFCTSYNCYCMGLPATYVLVFLGCP